MNRAILIARAYAVFCVTVVCFALFAASEASAGSSSLDRYESFRRAMAQYNVSEAELVSVKYLIELKCSESTNTSGRYMRQKEYLITTLYVFYAKSDKERQEHRVDYFESIRRDKAGAEVLCPSFASEFRFPSENEIQEVADGLTRGWGPNSDLEEVERRLRETVKF